MNYLLRSGNLRAKLKGYVLGFSLSGNRQSAVT